MEKYGFVYIWYDRKHKRFYIGSHWGHEGDGYICSSKWMYMSFKRRPDDFGGREGRKILKTNILSKQEMYEEEQRWLNMIKVEEIGKRYYNLKLTANGGYGLCTPDIAKNISAAKKGKALTEAHKKALTGIKKPSHTDEWKAENSKRMKEQWDNGSRKRAELKITLSREEQAALCSSQLKQRWADPEWAEKQRVRLSEGAKSRPPRSEESKQKARMAQLGKPKPRKIII